ncbi:hypothetical protein PoHVEF18_006819 [Penicillium ochrochloron]
MPSNRAAWQDAVGIPLSIRQTPYQTNLTPTQILIKPQAWAINPADHILQDLSLPFVKYPVILGEDIAGTIEAVGSEASAQFQVHDRVLAFAQGATRGSAMGGFQEYVVVDMAFTCGIPGEMSFAEASVFPLGFTTAAHALFNSKTLALPGPEVDAVPGSKGERVLVWGGASSVGGNAIQLARAAGLEVLTTASKRNFEYVGELGASMVFDYGSESVVADLVSELDNSGVPCVGIFQAAGHSDSLRPCFEIAQRATGDIFVITTSPLQEGVVPEGVRAKMLLGDSHDDILSMWKEFLPKALEEGKYIVAPEPLVVETTGLEGIQLGYDILKKGVSARKVVVLAD